MATVAGLITEFRRLVQDARAPYRYTDATARGLINSAIQMAISLKPSIANVTENLTLVPGPRQTIPGLHTQNFQVIRNMGATGNKPGRAVTPVVLNLLNRVIPGWMASTPAAEVHQYAVDPEAADVFYVYPPVTGGQQVEVNYDAVPPAVTDVTTDVPVNDRFAAAIPYGMAAAAFAADSDDPANAAQRQMFMGEFMLRLGVANAGK